MRFSMVLLAVWSVANCACSEDANSPDLVYFHSHATAPALCGTPPDLPGSPVWIRYRDPANGCAESEEQFVGCAGRMPAPDTVTTFGYPDPKPGSCAYDPDSGYTYCAGGGRELLSAGDWIGYMVQEGEFVAAGFIPLVNEDPDDNIDPRVARCWPEYFE